MVWQTVCSQTGMATLEYSFELRSDLSELETLRHHLNNFGTVAGLPKPCLFDVNVCLDEIFTNIVLYGFSDDSAHSIAFSVKAERNELSIVIEDDGVPFDPLAVEDPKVPADLVHLKIGGLGIHIVKKLMDEVCYKRMQGKNKLTLKKSIENYR